jgi:D-alanine-D-alanine ligase
MKKKVLILHSLLSENPGHDELDVLDQANFIEGALKELGYETSQGSFGYNLKESIDFLQEQKPDIIFNLVESIENKGEYNYFAPAIFNSLGIPYTGFPLEALFITTSKVLSKKTLKSLDVNSAEFFMLDEMDKLNPDKRYIVKPIWEDGSLGITDESVFKGNDIKRIERIKNELSKKSFFIEEYIDGREFNLSVLGSPSGPEVMPPAEIIFEDYPDNKLKIVNFAAKWKEDSYEYNHTPRTFEIKNMDASVLKQMQESCKIIWNHLDGRGYSRIDFRVDKDNVPHVLEVNGNPCMAMYSGFVAATMQAGYSFTTVIERVIADALR